MSRFHCFTVATRVWGRRRVRPAWTKIWLSLLCGLGAAARPALAANGTWSSSAPSGLWNTSSDWVSGIVPGATSGTTNTDTATFNTTSTTTSILTDSNRNLENITFDTSAAAYTFNFFGPMVLTSGGTIQIAGTFTGSNITETLNTPLTLEGNYTFANNATNTGDVLTFAGAITNGTAVGQTLTVSGNDAVNINGAIGGTIGMTKNGNNTLTLGGSADNTGLGVIANGGTLLLAKSSSASVHAIGSGGLLINAGNVQLSGSGGDQISDSGTVTIQNTGVFTLAGLNETIGGLAGTSSAIVQNAATTPAALTTNNANGFSNNYFGTLRDGAGGGALSLVKSGNGEQDLSGNNTFTGGVTINAGTLGIGGSGALNSTTPNAVAFGPGSTGTLALNGNSVSIGGLSSSSPSAIIQGGPATLTVIESGNETFAGSLQDQFPGTTATLSFVKAGAGSLTLSGNNTFSGSMTVNAGNLTLSGSNSFSGGLTINAGSMTLSSNNTFTGGVTINAGAALQIGNPGALNSARPNAVTDNGTLTLNGNSVTLAGLNGSGIVQNASAANVTLTVGNLSNTIGGTFAGTLQDGSGGGKLSLVVNGSGTGEQNLSGNNTLTGGVTVNGGTLAITGGSTVANVAINGGTFGMTAGSLVGDVTASATFLYAGGTLSGRLIVAGGALEIFAPITVANVLENDGGLTLPATFTLSGTTLPEAPITLGGPGLDNEGTLTMAGGTLNLSTSGGAANVNRGTFNLSATVPFNLNGATLTNAGALNLNGGTLSGASGLLTNGAGGTISGPGTISSGFSNAGGGVVLSSGAMNISQPFSNTSLIEMNGIAANLAGGAITNSGTIQGFGNIGNAITNTGTIEPIGGTLFLGGTLLNPAGGLIRAGTGNKLLVSHGLLASAGVVNLTGGTFDNNGQPMNNLGQISGFGTFATGGTGLDNNGSVTFSGGLTTVNGPVTNENGKTIVVAYNPAIFTGLVTNNGGGTFNIISTTAVFAGGSSGTFGGTFTNNANSAFSEGGSGTLEVDGAPTMGLASSLAVNDSSTLRFKATTGSATIGTGVTATVNNGATLELAGSVSALSNGPNRVNVTNNSTAAAGILVSGTHQQVGNIDGSGVTQVNAGSDLTANHIVQSELVIGGTAGSPALVTIDASDSSGNPLSQSSGLALAGSLQSTAPFASDAPGSSSLDPPSADGFSGDPIPADPSVDGTTMNGNPSAVPEPSTLLLALLGLASLGYLNRRDRR
ncbi:MAG TPA: autotransporter-associated beta strand repeat-containing protein [Pirellulales bacterium]|nr:autotransporter-associated beta strand repeat-containing protein [Pirellulales bacterium]